MIEQLYLADIFDVVLAKRGYDEQVLATMLGLAQGQLVPSAVDR